MNHLSLGIVLSSLLGGNAALIAGEPSDCRNFPGQTQCVDQTLESLTENGVVSLVNTHITGQLRVNGLLSSKQSNIHQAIIHGNADVVDTHFGGFVHIKGMLTAKHSQFSSELEVTSNRLVLRDSEATQITCLPEGSDQHVELWGKTVVKGPIRFVGGRGTVDVHPGASMKGGVEGGRVITHDR